MVNTNAQETDFLCAIGKGNEFKGLSVYVCRQTVTLDVT